jgi:plastocyanin
MFGVVRCWNRARHRLPRGDNMMRHVVTLLLSTVLTAGMLTACGGQDESSGPPITQYPATETTTTAQPAGPQIVISGMSYTVPPSVKPGERITVVNNADANHTVTADADNLFDVRISGGGGFSTLIAPTTPGTYPFHCKYHAGMHGSLIVQ